MNIGKVIEKKEFQILQCSKLFIDWPACVQHLIATKHMNSNGNPSLDLKQECEIVATKKQTIMSQSHSSEATKNAHIIGIEKALSRTVMSSTASLIKDPLNVAVKNDSKSVGAAKASNIFSKGVNNQKIANQTAAKSSADPPNKIAPSAQPSVVKPDIKGSKGVGTNMTSLIVSGAVNNKMTSSQAAAKNTNLQSKNTPSLARNDTSSKTVKTGGSVLKVNTQNSSNQASSVSARQGNQPVIFNFIICPIKSYFCHGR